MTSLCIAEFKHLHSIRITIGIITSKKNIALICFYINAVILNLTNILYEFYVLIIYRIQRYFNFYAEFLQTTKKNRLIKTPTEKDAVCE